MPNLAANLSLMFNVVPFRDRFAQAASSGFKAVEFLVPDHFPAADLRSRRSDNALAQPLFNMPPATEWQSRGTKPPFRHRAAARSWKP